MARELVARFTLKDGYTATMEKIARSTNQSKTATDALQKAQSKIEKAYASVDKTRAQSEKASAAHERVQARVQAAAERAAASRKQLAVAEQAQQSALAEATRQQAIAEQARETAVAEAAAGRTKAAAAAETQAQKADQAGQKATQNAVKAGEAMNRAGEAVNKWDNEYESLSKAADKSGNTAKVAAERAAAAVDSAQKSVDEYHKNVNKPAAININAEKALATTKTLADTYKKGIGKAWNIAIKAKDGAQRVVKPLVEAHKAIATKAWDLTIKVKDAAGATLKKMQGMMTKLAKGAVITLTVAGTALTALSGSMIGGGMELENYEVSMSHFIDRFAGQGESGDNTKAVQQALKDAGLYKGNVDGIIGPLTKAALASYQGANGLDVTKAIDPQTIAAMFPSGNTLDVQGMTQEYMDWLKHNANTTPFDTGEVIAAGSRAVQIAQGDTGQAQSLVSLAQDMAALTPGKTVMDAMEALADAQMGEMERLKEFGMKVTQADWKDAGGDLFTMTNAQGMTMPEVFGGGAEALSRTGSGLWSTITGSTKSAFQEAGRDMLEGLKPGLQALVPLVDEFTPHIRNFGKTAGEWIGKGVKKVIEFKDTVEEWVDNNQPLIDAIRGKVRGFGITAGIWIGKAVTKAGEIKDSVVEWVENNQPLINGIKDAIKGFGLWAWISLTSVGGKVNRIKEIITGWYDDNEPKITEIKNAITGFAENAGEKLDEFGEGFDIAEIIGGALTKIGDTVLWLYDLWILALPTIQGFLATVVEYIPTAQQVFFNVLSGIGDILVWLWDLWAIAWPYIVSIVKWAVGFIADAADWIIDNWEWIAPLVQGVVIAFGAFGAVLLVVSAAAAVFNAVMAINPITWIILGVGLLIGGLILLRENWDSVMDAIDNGLTYIYVAFKNIMLHLVNLCPPWLIELFGGDKAAMQLQIEEDIRIAESRVNEIDPSSGGGGGRGGAGAWGPGDDATPKKDRQGGGGGSTGEALGRAQAVTSATYTPNESSATTQATENSYTAQVDELLAGMKKAADYETPDTSNLATTLDNFQKGLNENGNPFANPVSGRNEYQDRTTNRALEPQQITIIDAKLPGYSAPEAPTGTDNSATIKQAATNADASFAALESSGATIERDIPEAMLTVSTAVETASADIVAATGIQKQAVVEMALAMKNAAKTTEAQVRMAANAIIGRITGMVASVTGMSGRLGTASDLITQSAQRAESRIDQAMRKLENLEIKIKVTGPDAPGYAKGLDYVPYDEFPARLHKGESVLTRDEANQWRAGKSSGSAQVIVNNNVKVIRQGPGEDDEAFAYRVASIIARETEAAQFAMP